MRADGVISYLLCLAVASTVLAFGDVPSTESVQHNLTLSSWCSLCSRSRSGGGALQGNSQHCSPPRCSSSRVVLCESLLSKDMALGLSCHSAGDCDEAGMRKEVPVSAILLHPSCLFQGPLRMSVPSSCAPTRTEYCTIHSYLSVTPCIFLWVTPSSLEDDWGSLMSQYQQQPPAKCTSLCHHSPGDCHCLLLGLLESLKVWI